MEAKIGQGSTALREVWMVRAMRSIQLPRPSEEDAKVKRPSASHLNRKVACSPWVHMQVFSLNRED
jgi:hypothetical protein